MSLAEHYPPGPDGLDDQLWRRARARAHPDLVLAEYLATARAQWAAVAQLLAHVGETMAPVLASWGAILDDMTFRHGGAR